MRIDKVERKRLNYILRELIRNRDASTSVMIVCPFPDRGCDESCGVLFPKLMDLKDDKDRLICPCFAMIDGHLPLKRVISKVRETLNRGEIIEE